MSGCVVIFSGGMNSTVGLYWAKQRFDTVHTLSVDYGQKHTKELTAAEFSAQLARVSHHEVVKLSSDMFYTSSSVICTGREELYNDPNDLRLRHENRLDPDESYIPFLNTHILLIAVQYALKNDLKSVVLCNSLSEFKRYNESSDSYFAALSNLIAETLNIDDIVIERPFGYMSKNMIISMAIDIPGCYNALAFTHTGHDNQYPPIGYDLATIERAAAFENAGTPDPLVIRAWKERRMDLPRGHNYDRFRSDTLFPREQALLDFLNQQKRS